MDAAERKRHQRHLVWQGTIEEITEEGEPVTVANEDPERTERSPATLTMALQVAVPLHITQMTGVDADELVATAVECADVVAAHGDDILYQGPRRGDTAKAFNALARGLAVLAHAPGGVDFAGLHFEVAEAVGARPVLALRRAVFAAQPREDVQPSG